MNINWHEGSENDEGADLAPEVRRHFEDIGLSRTVLSAAERRPGAGGALADLREQRSGFSRRGPQIEMIKILAGQTTLGAAQRASLPRGAADQPAGTADAEDCASCCAPRADAGLASASSLPLLWRFFLRCVLPMRVEGTAVVEPQHRLRWPRRWTATWTRSTRTKRAGSGANEVWAPQRLAMAANLAAAEAKYQQAMLQMEDDLAHGVPSAAESDRAPNVNYLRSEVSQARARPGERAPRC